MTTNKPRFTDADMLAAVDKMRASDKEKAAMREAIKRNDANAKFAIYGTMLRGNRQGPSGPVRLSFGIKVY